MRQLRTGTGFNPTKLERLVAGLIEDGCLEKYQTKPKGKPNAEDVTAYRRPVASEFGDLFERQQQPTHEVWYGASGTAVPDQPDAVPDDHAASGTEGLVRPPSKERGGPYQTQTYQTLRRWRYDQTQEEAQAMTRGKVTTPTAGNLDGPHAVYHRTRGGRWRLLDTYPTRTAAWTAALDGLPGDVRVAPAATRLQASVHSHHSVDSPRHQQLA